MKIDQLDTEEIAANLCGIPMPDDASIIDAALFDKYNINFEDFQIILKDLSSRIDIGKSPITDTIFIGFCNEERNTWLVKDDFTPEFINMVIEWLGGNEIKPSGKGFQREITKNGQVEFVITIRHPKK